MSKVEGVMRKIGFPSFYIVEPIELSGGLMVAWKEEVEVQILNWDNFYIHFRCRGQQHESIREVFGVYLDTDEAKRIDQFNQINQLIGIGSNKMTIMGDFNAITTHHEKEGGRSKSNTSIQDFNDFINSGNLMDLGYEGEKFTWCNRQFGGNLIRERLDQVLVSRSWREEFSNAYVTHLEDFGSDHRPLLLCEE
ncbi:uncharacterized protein LOC130939910 [Arachis stenosperma]|uniref:uncharacterized protein LOC130939910 n=1 Tax=Arachis stenosperma TaxID=217475 RepID=UPI0025AC2707|nr:uncharacterized protein LOC130939910 [Arachis stenosperma]